MTIRITEKIRKLLELANSDNEHEANLAAERAHRLMLKHNVSQTELTEDDYHAITLAEVKRLDPRWKFVQGILRLHFNVAPYSRRTHEMTECRIFGSKANVEIATYVYHFLMRAFRDLWREYKRNADGAPEAYKQAFWDGVAIGLDEQLTRSRGEFEGETGLIVANDPELDRFRERLGMRKQSSRIRHDANAQAAGEQAGQNLRIRKGVGGAATASGRYLK